MALIISDANIFIDLNCADLTARMFRLDFEFAVPDLLYHDELSQHHPELPGLGLQIRLLPPELIGLAEECRRKFLKLSIYYAFALVLARDESAPLLTGDSNLREAAETEGITVRGTLWLMGQMFERGLIHFNELKAAYQSMLAAQRRLPEAEIRKQLSRLRRRGR